jgi:hypothetical protein
MRGLACIARTHTINARQWRIRVITSKQQVTTLKSPHKVFIG